MLKCWMFLCRVVQFKRMFVSLFCLAIRDLALSKGEFINVLVKFLIFNPNVTSLCFYIEVLLLSISPALGSACALKVTTLVMHNPKIRSVDKVCEFSRVSNTSFEDLVGLASDFKKGQSGNCHCQASGNSGLPKHSQLICLLLISLFVYWLFNFFHQCHICVGATFSGFHNWTEPENPVLLNSEDKKKNINNFSWLNV